MPNTSTSLNLVPNSFSGLVPNLTIEPEKVGRSVMVVVENTKDLHPRIDPDGNSFTYVTIEQAIFTIVARKPDVLVISYRLVDRRGNNITELRSYCTLHSVPFILYSPVNDDDVRRVALKFGFDDYYWGNVPDNFSKRIIAIRKIKDHRKSRFSGRLIKNYYRSSATLRILKRTLDIVLAGTILLLLSPILLLVALIIKLESRGPIFYSSKRAGNGYQVFDFYKFRSMCNGADKDLHKLASQNQYGNSAFIKIKNDPRVTRFGGLLRMTSIDEIPQLFNVIKGDMSLVGNRPLPLYEAEQLTKDRVANRFMAPAGITGLWQITKRGKDEMSEQERIQLDLIYARKNSFLFDLKILFGTLPALLQKERV